MDDKKGKFVSVRIPESVLKELKAKAQEEMRTFSAQVLFYVLRGLEQDKKV